MLKFEIYNFKKYDLKVFNLFLQNLSLDLEQKGCFRTLHNQTRNTVVNWSRTVLGWITKKSKETNDDEKIQLCTDIKMFIMDQDDYMVNMNELKNNFVIIIIYMLKFLSFFGYILFI